MGDDYDSLCVDMLDELIQLCIEEKKPSKTVKELACLVTGWQKRRLQFEKYRRKFVK